MKTKELKSYLDVKMLDYGDNGTYLRVYKDRYCVVEVGLKKQYHLKVYESSKITEGLYRRLSEFAATPPTEREDEKKYYLRKINVPLLGETGDLYFGKPLRNWGSPIVCQNKTQDYKFQTTFTEVELYEMDITGFEKIEVTP